MKSKVTIIAAVVVVVVIAAAAYFYMSTPYTGYSSAFSNLTKAGSMEYNTNVKITSDGKTTSATGNMKIKGLNGGNVNFINVMNIDGAQISQFSDGKYIYKDNGGEKTKFEIGVQLPQMEDKGEFNFDYFLKEFSGLLDASKIKELQIADKLDQSIIEKISKKSVGGKTQYDVELAAQLVNNLINSLTNSGEAVGQNPEYKLNSFKYSATANSSKCIDSITYNADLDVTFPASLTGGADDTKSMQVELTLDITNPGPVDFSLPDTSGY